jgi:hypothetical protein
VGEAAQADYEALRESVLQGTPPLDLAAARFRRLGLAALITRPASEPLWQVQVIGARRPPWSPHVDPRVQALAATYTWLLLTAPAPARSAGWRGGEAG